MSVVSIGGAIVALALLVLFVWALVSVIGSRFDSDVEKVVWVIVVIFLPLLGPILWFAWGRSARTVS